MCAMDDEAERERRTDPHRLPDRVAVLEDKMRKVERLAEGANIALFGLPQDKESNGLVGELRRLSTAVDDMNLKLAAANNKLIGLLLTVLGAVAADILTRHG